MVRILFHAPIAIISLIFHPFAILKENVLLVKKNPNIRISPAAQKASRDKSKTELVPKHAIQATTQKHVNKRNDKNKTTLKGNKKTVKTT